MNNDVDTLIRKLEASIASGQFVDVESDTVELKPVPSDSGSWKEIYVSACAFLNSRGGMIVLGVKEEQVGRDRRYVFTGWRSDAEPKLAQLPSRFTERDRTKADIPDAFPEPILRDFSRGQIAIQLVDALAADRKYVFYEGKAYLRQLTGDHVIGEDAIARQEEFKREAMHARELQPVPGVTASDLDVDKLNEFITLLNRPKRIETMKPDIAAAMPFLERKYFVKDGEVTTLGVLVCGRHPSDHLGFRCHVHCYVNTSRHGVKDKQDFVDNIIPLMEDANIYANRNIHVGISPELGGKRRPEYPEELLRETINNALAHRDYSINKQISLDIVHREHLSIMNPGRFQPHLLIEIPDRSRPIKRIIPEAKPQNPKLADVLRVFQKWEGRGYGMATLVDACLRNEIDLPYYMFRTEEVRLTIRSGRLLDDGMERLFDAFEGYVVRKASGHRLTEPQKTVLAYLIKSERDNLRFRYTILLTPDNNHFSELTVLEGFGLIEKHPSSTPIHPVYVVDPVLVRTDYTAELRAIFGVGFDGLDEFRKRVLGVMYRHGRYSKLGVASAKDVSYALWHDEHGSREDIKEFDKHYRKVRRIVNDLTRSNFIAKKAGSKGYVLDETAATTGLPYS